jgi:hypothetical protein
MTPSEKFLARRQYVNEIAEMLGCTQDSIGNWKFPNEATLDEFEALMDAYDMEVIAASNVDHSDEQ